jgi:hypothetical protein
MALHPSLPTKKTILHRFLVVVGKRIYASDVQAIPVYLVLGTTCWMNGKGSGMQLAEEDLQHL